MKKLVERVKKVLVGYDYLFECARGLPQVTSNRDLVKKEVDDAQRKLDELQLSKGVEEFRETFEHNRAVMVAKANQLKSLQLGNYLC